MVGRSIAALPSGSHDLLTRRQLNVWELLVQRNAEYSAVAAEQAAEGVIDMQDWDGLKRGKTVDRDVWESVGEGDLASTQLLKAIVGDCELTAWSLSQY